MSEVIRLSLDTEFITFFNTKNIKTISMGIVPIDNADLPEFYEVRSELNSPSIQKHRFLKKEVIPKLFIPPFENKKPVSRSVFRNKLSRYFYEVAKTAESPTEMEIWVKSGKTDLEILNRKMNKVFKRVVKMTNISSVSFNDICDLPDITSLTYLTKPNIQNKLKHNSYHDAFYQASYIRWIDVNRDTICNETTTMNVVARNVLINS